MKFKVGDNVAILKGSFNLRQGIITDTRDVGLDKLQYYQVRVDDKHSRMAAESELALIEDYKFEDISELRHDFDKNPDKYLDSDDLKILKADLIKHIKEF